MKTRVDDALPVRSLIHDDGAHLYLWGTNNHLPDGLKVMDAWNSAT